MSRALRYLAAVAGVVVMTAATASPCAGWEATPDERHDCCERRHCQHAGDAGNSGSSQADADQCCARSERGTADRSESQVAPIVQTMSPDTVTIMAPIDTQFTSSSLRHRPPGTASIHLLHSVLLI